MRDYGAVVLLDLQKTASTFVCSVLDRVLALPPVEPFRQHECIDRARISGPQRPFVVMTIRDPLDQWISLYNFGVDGKGVFRERLSAAGDDADYTGTPSGLISWLTRCLDPREARLLGEGYERAAPDVIGFQAHRFLRLATSNAHLDLPSPPSPRELVDLYERECVVNAFIGQGFLSNDLNALLNGPLAAWVRPDLNMEQVLSGFAARNESSHSVCRADVPSDLAEQVYEREWLLCHVLAGLNVGDCGPATER